MAVGTSFGRTPGKHWLLDKFFGTLTGASYSLIVKRQMLKLPLVFLDLCAGDGRDTIESGTCSPGIIWKHATWFKDRMGENSVVVILVEKDRATYDLLRQKYESLGACVIHGDSSEQSTIDLIKKYLFSKISPSSPVLIHHDPNVVTNWCLSRNYLDISNYATAMVTMGCNVGGVKRLPLPDRMEWYKNFADLTDHALATNGRLDVCLSALKKDSSNWAYAVSAPSVWKDKVEVTVKNAFKDWKNGIEIEWMNSNPEFNTLIDKLFLTKEEFDQDGGINNVAQ